MCECRKHLIELIDILAEANTQPRGTESQGDHTFTAEDIEGLGKLREALCAKSPS